MRVSAIVVAMGMFDDRPFRWSQLFNHEHYLWAALCGLVLTSAWFLFLTMGRKDKMSDSSPSGFRYLIVATFCLMFVAVALALFHRAR